MKEIKDYYKKIDNNMKYLYTYIYIFKDILNKL
jgi:hypothetical protein